MKLTATERTYDPGYSQPLAITCCGRVELEPEEMLTFAEGSAELDVYRKSFGWAFSSDERLKRFGSRFVFARSDDGKFCLFVVEDARQAEFQAYVKKWGYTLYGYTSIG